MKIRTPSRLLFIILLIGFTKIAIGQEYTYLVTVTSSSEEEQSFNLEISSKIESSAESITIVLSDQATPFKRILEKGEHLIVVEQEKQGSVVSKVTGIVAGETKGSAASDDRKTFLTAGPGGRYSAGLKFK